MLEKRALKFITIALLAAAQGMAAEDTRASRIAEYEAKAAKATKEKSARLWLEAADFALKRQLWEFYVGCLKHAVEADPKNAEAQQLLNKKLVGSEWLTEEETFEREAKQKSAHGLVYYANSWGTPAQVDAVRAADRKTVGWDVQLRVQSPKGYVTVYSNESLAATRRAAAITEASGYAYWEFYQSTFKLKFPPPLTVYLFKDRATFDRVYMKNSKQQALSDDTAGVYSCGSKILFVHTDSGIEGDSYLSTMAHEMIHAMDDRLAGIFSGNAPDWLMEGRAEHIGTYARRDSIVVPGYVGMDSNTAAVRYLSQEMKNLNLAQFLKTVNKDGLEFSGYCLSFAFIHFLFHAENEKYAPAFRRFLAAGAGKYTFANFESAVGKIETLEPAFKKYVQDFLLPGMIAAQKVAQDERETAEAAREDKKNEK